MSAGLLTVVLAGAALAVDQGAIYFERREAQALTDLAAITAAAHIEKAPDAALLTFTDNRERNITLIRDDQIPDDIETGSPTAKLHVQEGRYEADPAIEPMLRFTVGGEPFNAVRVTYSKKATLYFGSAIMEPPTITTTAVAASREEAAISIGSRLASVDNGVLNALLGGLLGTNLSLKAVDYQALADADVELLSFVEALAGELRITAGTYDDVLAAEATVGQILDALYASVGQAGARVAIEKLLNSAAGPHLQVPLSHLVDLGTLGQIALGQGTTGLQAGVGVMEMIGASLAIANRDRQIDLGGGLRLPGDLAGISIKIAVGEPPLNLPWLAVGEAGTIVRTSQIRVSIIAEVLGGGGILNFGLIHLPLYLEIGYAEAKLRNLVCEGGQLSRVVVDGRPGIFAAWLGDIDPGQLYDFDSDPSPRPAKLVDLLAVKVTGAAYVTSGNMQPTRVTFNRREVDDGVVKTIDTSNLTQPLVQSLISELHLEAEVLGGVLGIGLPLPGLIKRSVAGILGGVTQPLDQVVYGLLTTLGVRVGEADIRVNGAQCDRAVLVR